MIGHPERVALLSLVGFILDWIGLLVLIAWKFTKEREFEPVDEDKQNDATQ